MPAYVYRAPRPAQRKRRLFTAPTTPLVAGVASFVSSGPAGIAVTATDATNGTKPYTYQWQRSTDGGAYSNLSGATTLSITDTTAVAGHLYGYKLVYTDSTPIPQTATSNAVTAQVYTGGAIGSGTASKSGQRRRWRAH